MNSDITISLAQFFWLIGGATALIGLGTVIAKPFKKLEDHETRINVLEQNEQARKATDRYTGIKDSNGFRWSGDCVIVLVHR